MSRVQRLLTEGSRVVSKYKDPLYEFAGGLAAGKIRDYVNATPPNKKRKSTGPPQRKKNVRVSSKFVRMANGDTGATTRKAQVGRAKGSKRTVKQVTNRGKKTPKISRKFRKAVTKALEVTKTTGKFEGLYTEAYILTANNVQLVKYLGTDAVVFSHAYFHPLRVLDAASVLFNKKAASILNVNGTDTNNFNWTNIKIHVKKSWVELRMRNNSGRTYSGFVYECSPKSNQATDEPIAAWLQGLLAEATATTGAIQTGQTTSANSNINIGGTLSVGNLHASPVMSEQFKRWFNVVRTKVVIEPGQSWDMIINGPKDYTYNYPKMWNNTSFNGIQKCNRYVFFGLNLDLVADITGLPGRLGINTAAHPSEYLICETRQLFDIEMPEETGFVANTTLVANVPQNLNQRHKAKYFVNWNPVPTYAATSRVDEENPTIDVPT